MDPISFNQLALWADGVLVRGDGAKTVTRVCTDSRKLAEGDLFVALRGEKFDGHEFLHEVFADGAAGALVDDAFNLGKAMPPGFDEEEDFTVIRVADTLAGLQAIARRYRASLPLRVIGITGSSGKTSTKDFTAAVLARKYRVVKTEGNFNNHIGLPLTILRASAADEIGIFEMGMNHPGEIAPLAAIAAPDAAIITNIGVAHIEFMGSRDGIALEKGRLAEALPAAGSLVMNAGDDFSDSIAARSPAGAILTGVGDDPRIAIGAAGLETGFDGSRFRVEDRRAESGERKAVEVYLPVPGIHMVENALLALAAGTVFGVSLADGAAGLAQSRLTKGRLEQKTLGGIHFLDDSYNANPDSMRAALATLASLPVSGARIAVLGKMGELGSESQAGHRSVGEAAARAKIDRLIVVGGEAAPIALAAREGGLSAVDYVDDTAAAARLLAEHARPGDLVLVKGSRSARMEKVLDHPKFAPLAPV